MAEFILKDWYGKDQVFNKKTIYVQGKDGQLLQFTNAAVESEEMIYYRSLAETLMTRNAKYFGETTKLNLKNFVLSDGDTLGSVPPFSFAGFDDVEGMSFTDIILVQEDAFYGCTKLKVIDITVPASIRSSAFMQNSLRECPNVESIIFRDGGEGLTGVNVASAHGGNDSFYIYVPTAYYDTVTASLSDYHVPKSRYRKLEDYPLIDRWDEAVTVSWYDQNGTTLLKSEKYLPGDIPSYTPTKDGYNFLGWTPEPVPVTGDAKYVARWEEPITFATGTWTQIGEACAAGNASKLFKVGDKKAITLNYADGTSENTYATIVDMGVDKKQDGSKAALTIMLDNIVKPKLAATGLTGGPYSNAKFTTFLATILAAMPQDLQSVVVPVEKSFSYTTVFIPGLKNLTGETAQYAYETPAVRYSHFAKGNSIKRTRVGNASDDSYLTSSVANSSGNRYYAIDGESKSTTYTSLQYDEQSIVPCFCIG